MVGERAVGRIIARPFVHENGKFTRTEDRKDYALEPPGETMLDILAAGGVRVVSVGKIYDLFCGRGIAEGHHTGNNAEGLEVLERLMESETESFVFANLVDTDMLYGHRNNAAGYAAALRKIDEALARLRGALREEDILIVTADHGCDPTTESTDHSREYVPLLIEGKRVEPKNLGTLAGFDHIANFVLALYGLRSDADIYDKIIRREL